MNINRNNYEKYFIDYLEGTLSKDDISKNKINRSLGPIYP